MRRTDRQGARRDGDCRRALTPDGTYVLIGHDRYGDAGRKVLGSLPRFAGLMARSVFQRQLPRPTRATPPTKDSMAVLADLLRTSELSPVIDRAFSLAEAPAALRYLTEGTARGRIVVTLWLRAGRAPQPRGIALVRGTIRACGWPMKIGQ